MEVRIFRTQMGEIIAKVKSLKDNVYQLTDASAFNVRQIPNSPEIEVIFGDIAQLAEKSKDRENKPLIDMELSLYAVLMSYKPQQSIEQNYLQAIDDVVIEAPSKPTIVV